MAVESTGGDLKVEKSIEAPPGVVFNYFTSSKKWSEWQGRETTIDPREGGAFTMRAPNGGVARGVVIEMVLNQRIVFTWGWEGHATVPPGSSTVTIELAPSPGGTLVTLTHTGLPLGETGLHRLGWEHYLNRLCGVVSGKDVGDDRGVGSS